jgi:hypothetical protein
MRFRKERIRLKSERFPNIYILLSHFDFCEILGSQGDEYEDSLGILRLVVWYKLTDVSKVLTETTWRSIPEDAILI